MASSAASKQKPKSKKTVKRVRRSLNLKGLIVFGLILLVSVPGLLLLKWFSDRQVRSSALEQAKARAKDGNFDLAMRHLDRLLADNPNDLPALEAKAKLLADASQNSNQGLLEAARIHDLLIRLDPKGEGRLETRRKLAELYLRYSDLVRRDAGVWNEPIEEAKEVRYQAAAQVAQQLIDIEKESQPPIQDAVAHRLLAMAYMGQMPNLTVKSTRAEKELPELLKNAKAELVEALRIDPRDLISSEKLAELYLTRLNDPGAAERVLDGLLQAMPKSVEVRMSRYRAFTNAKRLDKAKAELDSAIAMSPENFELRLRAAGDALARQETPIARQHLEAIPAESRKSELRFRILLGQVEFAEQHPDDAIDQWRQGLSLVGGGDVDLTWYTALSTIRVGGPRLSDALPLIHQYGRFAKDDRTGKGLFLQALYDQKMGHFAVAIEGFEKVVRINRGELLPDAYMFLGSCFENIGETEKAQLAYMNASKAAPTASGPRRAIARMRQAKNPEQAAAELERVLNRQLEENRTREDKTPEDAATLFDLLRIRLVQELEKPLDQRSWQGIEGLLARVKLVKKGALEESTYRGLYAEYLVGSNRGDEALKLLEAATQSEDRKLVATWLNLAYLLDRQSRRGDAIKTLDRGMAADAAGDHSSLRILKAQLLINEGKGHAARDTLSKGVTNIPMVERPEIYRALGNLQRSLGDREGARSSYVEWARLVPESIEPAQALLNFAETYGDDEAAKLGLEALGSGRARTDPYAIVARALELLRVDRNRPGPPPADRIEQAERLAAELNKIAPALSWRSLIEGRIQEFRGNLDKAAVGYRNALKVGMTGPALPRLIEVYMKLHANDELAKLEKEYLAASVQSPNLFKEFARISLEVARKLGDKDRVAYFTNQLVDGKSESAQIATAQAQLLDSLGKTQEAEQKLQELVKSKPQDPLAWYALIRYQSIRRTPADVAKSIDEARRIYQGERPDLFLAICYRFGGDPANAARYYQNAKDKAPGDLTTLAAYIEYCETTGGKDGQIEPLLRKALSIDPAASWAAKTLALRISSKPDPATWTEAWNLVAPGSSGSGDAPEDRLVRATVLARSPESSRRIEAVAAFVGLIEDLPIAHPIGIDARIRLSQAMIEYGKYIDAWTYIAPLADDHSRFNAVALTIGIEALARSGKPEEAQKRLNRLSEQVPKWPQTPLLKAWVSMAKGQKAEASAELNSVFSAAENTPEGETTGLSVFDLLIRFGDPESAYDVAQRLAKHWPKDAWTLARVQIIRQEYDQALASCRIALQAGGPVEAREASRSATSAAIAKRSDPAFVKQAEVIDQAARAKSPNDYNIYVNLAAIYHMQGRYEEEIANYSRALELNPTTADFLNNMAWTLSEGLGKYQEALKYVEDSIRRVGATADFLDTRGVIQSRLGNLKQAIADLESSIKVKPLALTYFHLSRIYYKAGNLTESRRNRDLAWKAKFNPDDLDPTDRADLTEVMGKAKP